MATMPYAAPFIPTAVTPEEQAAELALMEAAARGEELLRQRLAERQPLRRGREPVCDYAI